MRRSYVVSIFFFFNDTATTEIYTLSLHDALPILGEVAMAQCHADIAQRRGIGEVALPARNRDRKSTRLNSSHLVISYAVFCLKKKTPPTREDAMPPAIPPTITHLIYAAVQPFSH